MVRGLAWASLGLAGAVLILPFCLQALALRVTDNAIEELRPAVAQAEELRRGITADGAGREVLAQEMHRTGDVLQVLATITRILPDDTYLTDFALRSLHLTIGGRSASAPRLITGLSGDPAIRNAAFAAPVTRVEGATSDVFSIQGEIVPDGAVVAGRAPRARVANYACPFSWWPVAEPLGRHAWPEDYSGASPSNKMLPKSSRRPRRQSRLTWPMPLRRVQQALINRWALASTSRERNIGRGDRSRSTKSSSRVRRCGDAPNNPGSFRSSIMAIRRSSATHDFASASDTSPSASWTKLPRPCDTDLVSIAVLEDLVSRVRHGTLLISGDEISDVLYGNAHRIIATTRDNSRPSI